MTTKRALVILLVGLILTMGALLNSQRLLLFAIHEAMDRFTDLRLELSKPHIEVFAGVVSVEELQLFPESGGPAIVSATGLQGEIWLPDLWQGDLSLQFICVPNFHCFNSSNAQDGRFFNASWVW